MRLPYKRSGLRTYLILIGIIANSCTPVWIIIGLPFFISGIFIRLWAKGCLHQNREVTILGPYRFVRHPFYFGNLLLDFGIVLMSGFIPLIIAFPFLWFSIYIPTMKKEESTMIKLFGNAYKKYQNNIPMIIPYKKSIFIKNDTGFSWDNPNIYRTEIPRTIRFLCYPFIFSLLYLIRNQGIYAINSTNIFITGALIISLYIVSWQIKNHFAYSKNALPFSMSIDKRFLILTGIIIFGFLFHWAELEYDNIIWPLGIFMLGASFFIKNPIKSEWIIAAGLCVLFELIWLAISISPIYLGLLLDRKTPPHNKRHIKLILLALGLLLAISKEVEL